jgi:hypothetical protein
MLSPTNPFFYCLLVRRKKLTELNGFMNVKTKKSIQRRFYAIDKSRCYLQLTYPTAMLEHAMNPYKYRMPKGRVSKLEKVQPFYIYQKECTKKEWINCNRQFGFQKIKYFTTSKEFGFRLIKQ